MSGGHKEKKRGGCERGEKGGEWARMVARGKSNCGADETGSERERMVAERVRLMESPKGINFRKKAFAHTKVAYQQKSP